MLDEIEIIRKSVDSNSTTYSVNIPITPRRASIEQIRVNTPTTTALTYTWTLTKADANYSQSFSATDVTNSYYITDLQLYCEEGDVLNVMIGSVAMVGNAYVEVTYLHNGV